MKTKLLTLLLLFTSSVIALGADRGVFREDLPSASDANFAHFLVGLLDSTLAPNKRTSPADQSALPAEKQYDESEPDADLYLSSSEKYDSSFGATIVLHLVTETRGKSAPDRLLASIAVHPSLRRLNVMLQV